MVLWTEESASMRSSKPSRKGMEKKKRKGNRIARTHRSITKATPFFLGASRSRSWDWDWDWESESMNLSHDRGVLAGIREWCWRRSPESGDRRKLGMQNEEWRRGDICFAWRLRRGGWVRHVVMVKQNPLYTLILQLTVPIFHSKKKKCFLHRPDMSQGYANCLSYSMFGCTKKKL